MSETLSTIDKKEKDKTSIPRIQKQAIAEALSSSKIVLIQAADGLFNEKLVNEILQEKNLTSISLDADQMAEFNKGNASWKTWLKENRSAPVIIMNRGELMGDLDPFIEAFLADENLPNLIVLCQVKPHINELLFEALEANNLAFTIHPPSFYEIAQVKGMGSLEAELEERLIFGSYPEVMQNPESAAEKLNELIDSMLSASLSAKERINKKEALKKTLQVFAFEMGNLVSYNEVGTRTDLDNETVERYVQLFEKANIVKVIPSYNGGNKYEMKKGASVFFIDNGLRNALINNFNSMDWRQDATQLWRNWLLMEKMKWNELIGRKSKLWTWRTHTNQRIDFMEVFEGAMKGYQVSWTKKKKPRFPASFGKYYPEAQQNVLNRSTYWTFLSSKR
jgi:predicted AAA+ superfamily ATPase